MILLPIGRDDAEIRRHAWVSYVIIGLNVLAFLITVAIEHGPHMTTTESRWSETINFLLARPYLRVPASLKEVLNDEALAQLEERRRAAAVPEGALVRSEQEQLNHLAEGAVEAYRQLPTIRFGYIPSRGHPLTLVTSMFMHAGVAHLVGNLLIFFLSGPVVEDVFGRPLFAGLYFTGGIVAALTYAARHGDSTVPLVGASGAIAAVMGAYLVRFLRSRIEFLWVPFIIRPSLHFRFFLPAFVVLPIWFAQQLLEMNLEDAGGGVAFSAHVGGFIFGVVAALVVKMTGFEEKHVDPVVQKETTWSMDERLVQAVQAHRVGNDESAKQLVLTVLRDTPNDFGALRTALEIARDSDDLALLDNAASRLLARHVAEHENDVATELIHEITSDRTMNPPKFLARAATFAERSGDRDWAVMLYERAIQADPNSAAAVSSLIRVGTLLRASGDASGARDAFVRARDHPACSLEWFTTIDAKLEQLS
jgi:membrane associated rhomboid family serine protease